VGTVGPPVYQELHRLAGMHMRGERPGHPLQTTALVNEAYLRLQKADGVRWQNRPHFCAWLPGRCATFSLIFARVQPQQKRDGGRHVDLNEALTNRAWP
jgi:hypothetical protein